MNCSTGRRTGNGAALRLFATAVLFLAGCSGAGTGDTPEEFESRSQALRCHDGYGNPLNDADCPWKSLSRLTPFEPLAMIGHAFLVGLPIGLFASARPLRPPAQA